MKRDTVMRSILEANSISTINIELLKAKSKKKCTNILIRNVAFNIISQLLLPWTNFARRYFMFTVELSNAYRAVYGK